MKKATGLCWLIATFLTLSILVSQVVAHQQVVVVPLNKRSKSPTENVYINSLGMTFNLLPAGSFLMGRTNSEPGVANLAEQPQHQVTLTKSFYMQTTEVTQAQWEAIALHPSVGGSNPSTYSGADHPVEGVNWYEAASFANWLSFAEGKMICYTYDSCTGTLGSGLTCTNVQLKPNCTGYRLPTEAEWEYAVRATTTTPWTYAVNYDASVDPGQILNTGFNSNVDAMGWYGFNNATQYAVGTKPVAKKQANKWGLYDMMGNVVEWCQDWYLSNYYSDPASAVDPQGPSSGTIRVYRDTSFPEPANFARSASRGGDYPINGYSYLGFRLVLQQ